eukprot:SAG31_NODE_19031_length_614_cov_0.627184_2_plen_124_part_01
MCRFLNYCWHARETPTLQDQLLKAEDLAIAEKLETPYRSDTNKKYTDVVRSALPNGFAERADMRLGKLAHLQVKVKLIYKNVPCQDNGSDCGVFVLEYVERFILDLQRRTHEQEQIRQYILKTV